MVQFTTQGKLILMGEHSVLYGYKAVAIPFKAATLDVVVSLNSEPKMVIDCDFYKGVLDVYVPQLKGLYTMLKQFMDDFHLKPAIKIQIVSRILPKKGLGSSAASSFAVLEAVSKYYRISLNNQQQIMYVQISEHINHYTSSGLDITAIISSKPLIFENMAYHLIESPLKGYLLVVDSKIESQTAQAVYHIRHHADRDSLIAALGMQTDLFLSAMKKHDFETVKNTMYQAQTYLKKLGVSHPKIDDIVDFAKAHGVAAKLTGGGMGGLVILYHEKKDVLIALQKHMKYPSFPIIDLESFYV